MFRIYKIKTTVAYFLIVGSSCALLSHVLANVTPIALPWLLAYVAPLTITMYGILLEIAIFNAGLLFKAKAEEREKVRVHRAYISELKSRQELQTAYTQVRDKIASDLHDDIGSSLSSINIYSYAASQKLEQGEVEQAGGLLKNIERSAYETLASMSDLVWAINPNNDSSGKLIERVQSFAFEILSAADSRFEIDVDQGFYDVVLSQSERKNILLILKEAVNNAAKYAESSVVLLKITLIGDDAFIFSLSDNGKGIAPGQEQGNGMRTMRARATELGGFFEVKTAPGETSIRFGLRTEKAGSLDV
jgi:signal transduction histidine kinase